MRRLALGSTNASPIFRDYDNEEYSWGDVALGALLTIAPMALLAAALPSGLFTIAVK